MFEQFHTKRSQDPLNFGKVCRAVELKNDVLSFKRSPRVARWSREMAGRVSNRHPSLFCGINLLDNNLLMEESLQFIRVYASTPLTALPANTACRAGARPLYVWLSS